MTSEIGVIDLMGKDKNLRENFGLAQPYPTYKAGFLSTLQGKKKFQIPQGHISFIFQVPCMSGNANIKVAFSLLEFFFKSPFLINV